MNIMPKKLPPLVQRQRTRHGKIVFYFRRGKGQRIRLPDINADDFDACYQIARDETAKPAGKKIGVNSLEWLLTQYRQSGAYLNELSPATRRQRDNIFKHVIDSAGTQRYRDIKQKHIVEGRERRKHTPSQARNFLDAMRGLFRWAKEAQLVSVDPTAEVSNPKKIKGPGFPAWTEEDVDLYEAHWPVGTHERVWMHVLLYTGLRRGEAVVIGRQHVKNGIATIKTEKTGEVVFIPILPALEETLNIGPVGDLHWVVGKTGKPLKKESFGNMFKAACKSAGIPNKSAHGLRKIGAVRAAEAGATVAELESMYGWKGGTMASHYTRTANRKRLAIQGSEKVRQAQKENFNTPTSNTSSPHLNKKV